jgi:acyl-CoA thioester hydrolase
LPSETLTRLRVRYAETDAMGIVHHSHYAIWFEAGRTDFFREHGVSYRECEARDVYFPVTELLVRFAQPAVYDEEVTVHTRAGEVQSRAVTMRYEVRNESGALLATGYTRHICVDAKREVQSIPDWLKHTLLEDS